MDIVFKNLSHITVNPPEGEDYIHLYKLMIDKISGIEGIIAISPNLAGSATFAYKDNVENVVLVGTIPSESAKIGGLNENMVYGSYDSVLNGKRVLIGKSLADKMELKMGDTVEASFPDSKTMGLVVSGIFDSGYAEVDDAFAFVSLKTAREFIGEGDVVTSIDIKLQDIYMSEPLAEEIRSYGYEAKSWQEQYPEIVRTIVFEKTQNFITLMFILIIAAFGIASIMNMLVLEKTRDIGMLMALGINQPGILKIFIIESGILGFIGALFGCLLGSLVSIKLKQLEMQSPMGETMNLPVLLSANDLVTYTILAVALSVIAGLYPAYSASKLDPVEALKG